MFYKYLSKRAVIIYATTWICTNSYILYQIINESKKTYKPKNDDNEKYGIVYNGYNPVR